MTDELFLTAQIESVTVDIGEVLHIHANYHSSTGYMSVTLHITQDEYKSQLYVSGAGEPTYEEINGTVCTMITGDEDRVCMFSARHEDTCRTYIVATSIDADEAILHEAVQILTE